MTKSNSSCARVDNYNDQAYSSQGLYEITKENLT